MISDNGTKSVGAERGFAEYSAAWNRESIAEYLSSTYAWHLTLEESEIGWYVVLEDRSVSKDVLSTTTDC